MRRFPNFTAGILVSLLGFIGPCGAEVIRCADPAGQVSYTDGHCPPGARQVGTVAEPEAKQGIEPVPMAPATPPIAVGGARQRQKQHAPADPAALAAPTLPAGPTIIDPASQRSTESRWSDRGGDDTPYIDDGYPYPYAVARPPPPRNMGQRIRYCDARGCVDTQGNRYDNKGQLSSYRGPGGKTCTPVGTTQICR